MQAGAAAAAARGTLARLVVYDGVYAPIQRSSRHLRQPQQQQQQQQTTT